MKQSTTSVSTDHNASMRQPTTRYVEDNAALSIEVIAGITAGSVLFVIIFVSFVICCRRCLKKRRNQESYAENCSNSKATNITVDEVTESPNGNSQIHSDHEHTYAVLRVDKREKEIYSSTYRVPQSPAVVDAPDASLDSHPHQETADERKENCQGDTEELFYENVISPKCESASQKNDPIDKELTVVKNNEESFHTVSAQLKDLNNTESSGRDCYEIYPERPTYINLQELPVNGSVGTNSESPEVIYYNLN
ncbi:uncharacterized protein [Montipora capricornis]|uniref:uncharacterized protein n=1 Tax=Montipora capricornis TaxID=246305 RepID=UPI0035F1C48B